MKALRSLWLALIGLLGLFGTAHAEDWWWRHHHPDHVVVEVMPVVSISVCAPDFYHRAHQHFMEADVRLALARLGYYQGPMNGGVGSGSGAAIRSYQHDNGLPETGVVDSPLIRSLGL